MLTPRKRTKLKPAPRPTPQQITDKQAEMDLKQAYLRNSGGKKSRVRIADLYDALGRDMDSKTFNAHLQRLEREGHLVLYPLDYKPSITAADRRAAINVGGYDNHILYWNL